MRQSNSHRGVRGLIRGFWSLCLIGLIPSAVVWADDKPAAAVAVAARPGFAPGSEVMLKLPGLPIFNEGRVVAPEDNLTFVVDRAEGGRVLLVSRDEKTRGWVYDDELVSLEQAAEYFRQVVQNDTTDGDLSWVLGRLWFYLNDDVRAIVNLRDAVRARNSRPGCYLSRCLVYVCSKRFREAENDCETYLRLEPERAQGRFVREQIQVARKDYAAAMAALEQAFRLDPVNPFPRGIHASPGAAAAKPEPHTAAEWVARGEARVAAQDYDKAIDDFNAALKVDPRHAPAYISRARVWMLKYYRERALADYDAAVNLEPANSMFWVARAETWSASGRHEPAMADYAEALRLDPKNPAIWVSRGNEWRKDLKIDAAIADYNHAIQLNPKYVPAYVARGNTWKQISRFDLAIQGFSELVSACPGEPVGHQSLARILATAQLPQFRNGKWALDEATKACEQAHWIDPDSVDTLAAASAEVGQFESAVRWQTLAIKLVRQRYPSALQKKAISSGPGKVGVGFDDRLVFYKSKKPIRE